MIRSKRLRRESPRKARGLAAPLLRLPFRVHHLKDVTFRTAEEETFEWRFTDGVDQLGAMFNEALLELRETGEGKIDGDMAPEFAFIRRRFEVIDAQEVKFLVRTHGKPGRFAANVSRAVDRPPTESGSVEFPGFFHVARGQRQVGK